MVKNLKNELNMTKMELSRITNVEPEELRLPDKKERLLEKLEQQEKKFKLKSTEMELR